jgi:hypothetical protein
MDLSQSPLLVLGGVMLVAIFVAWKLWEVGLAPFKFIALVLALAALLLAGLYRTVPAHMPTKPPTELPPWLRWFIFGEGGEPVTWPQLAAPPAHSPAPPPSPPPAAADPFSHIPSAEELRRRQRTS